MNPYQRMHAARMLHVELARRARDYQATAADVRAQRDAAFRAGFAYGALAGVFLALLLATYGGWWR